jgi:hypothetical protein
MAGSSRSKVNNQRGANLPGLPRERARLARGESILHRAATVAPGLPAHPVTPDFEFPVFNLQTEHPNRHVVRATTQAATAGNCRHTSSGEHHAVDH